MVTPKMRSGIITLFLGGICGGALTFGWLAFDRDDAFARDGSASLESFTGLGTKQATRTKLLRSASVADRLEAYRATAEYRDFGELEAALQRAAAASPSPLRDAQIEAIVARLGELDVARAAALTRTLKLDTRFVAAAWRTWAEQEGEAALAALDTLEYPDARRIVAITLLDVFGSSLRGIERVAAALPPADRGAFQIEALARQAERDFYVAFSDALAIDDLGVRRRAVLEVVAVAARTDPQAALAQSELLSSELQAAARTSITAEWARLDAGGFLRSLSSSKDLEHLGGGIQMLLASDPGGLLQAVNGLTGPLVTQLNSFALAALAQIDARAAMAHAEATPPGQERERALQSVTAAYAQENPEAALAWAQSLSASPAVLRSVVMAIAAAGDVDRALSLVASGAAGSEGETVLRFVANRVAENPAIARELADKLVTQTDTQSLSLLERIVASWVRRNPDSALDWMLRNGRAVDAALVGNTARTYAIRDVAAAAEYTERLPAAVRSVWMTQVAAEFGRSDPTAAFRWLERYQGHDGHDAAVRQVLTEAAQTDPRAASSLFERAAVDVQLAAAQTVASIWTREEPEVAAQWAASLSDPRARSSAVAATAAAWAPRDAQAAERWALSLPSGALRDEALVAILPHSARSNVVLDDRLLTSLSVVERRNDILARIIPSMVARDNGDEARRLSNAYVTDPRLRQWLEQLIDGGSAETLPAFTEPGQSSNINR
jgi:hypothetical protein